MRTVSEADGCRIPRTFPPVPRLKRRADFLRAASGDRFHARAFSLQATPRVPLGSSEASLPEPSPSKTETDPATPRFGITVTKRIGGAVERNRIKRRFREALRLSAELHPCPGRDYVIVAKVEALTADFQALKTSLVDAIDKIDRPSRPRPPKAKNPNHSKRPAKPPRKT